MRYDEFLEIIYTSIPEDWSYDDDFGIYVYRNDINITIESDRSWPEGDETCHEAWSSQFSDSHAYRKRFILKYRGNFVKAIYGADVDGCRCFIPYPNINNMTITREQYGIGNIINGCISAYNEFESYLGQANITAN